MTDVSVVIVSYESRELLARCLAALAADAARIATVETIVVDQASQDGTAAWLAAERPDVHLVALPANAGFGAGNNRGAEVASGRWLLLLNSDAFVRPGAIDELRLGLQRDEFSLHYQPEIEVVGGAIVGVEALLRWTSPTRGTVPPGEFIPAAEATGMIMQLGQLALREACEQTVRWEREGLLPEHFITWVNLSGTQLSAGGIDTLVRGTLAETGLAPSRLGLEVTETAIVQG
ncbi:MAG: EAL domain-containing protein, partial [Actinomycetota bacterium]|nr:EAL domain-containing protein [Actinomycetota bacterium]